LKGCRRLKKSSPISCNQDTSKMVITHRGRKKLDTTTRHNDVVTTEMQNAEFRPEICSHEPRPMASVCRTVRPDRVSRSTAGKKSGQRSEP
jgi:hypothetical protein